MTDGNKGLIRQIYSIFLAALTIVVGVLFVVQIQGVYHSAEKNPYTVESVSAHFDKIAVWFYLWLGAIVVGGVLWLVFPAPKEKPKAYVELSTTLEKLQRRLPSNDRGRDELKLYRTLRIAVKCACVLICATALAVVFAYMLSDSIKLKAETGFFADHKEAERFLLVLPWIFSALVVWSGLEIFNYFVLKQEISLTKTRITENAKAGIKTAPQPQKQSLSQKITEKTYAVCPFLKSKWWKIGVRAGVAVLGITLVIVGIAGGGMREVLLKAINICTQCIGLG